jgi:hypothetical protein
LTTIVGDVPALPGVPGSVTVIVVDCMSTRVTVAVPTPAVTETLAG